MSETIVGIKAIYAKMRPYLNMIRVKKIYISQLKLANEGELAEVLAFMENTWDLLKSFKEIRDDLKEEVWANMRSYGFTQLSEYKIMMNRAKRVRDYWLNNVPRILAERIHVTEEQN